MSKILNSIQWFPKVQSNRKPNQQTSTNNNSLDLDNANYPILHCSSNPIMFVTITRLRSFCCSFTKFLVFRIVGDGHQSSSRIPLLRTHFCNPLFKVDLGYTTSERRGMLFINYTFRIPEKGNLDVIVFHEKAKRTQQGDLLR